MKNCPEKGIRYLATTALEDFWETDKPMLFLGPWCQIRKRKDFWGTLDYQMVPSSLDRREALTEIRKYAYQLYERLLKELSLNLNQVHNEEHSECYWKIIIGPWLNWYINVYLTRYVYIKDALNCRGNIKTIVLADDNYLVPKNRALPE